MTDPGDILYDYDGPPLEDYSTWEQVYPKPPLARASVLAVLPHDSWCKAGGTDHADCCPDEIAECARFASDSLDALVTAGLIEVAP